MTVYHKIVTIKVQDPTRPERELSVYARQIGGIDAILLASAPGLNEATFKLICSDRNPQTPRTLEDIDRLLSNSNIKILNEMSTHPNDPVTSGKVNHSLKIDANLDNPNLPDKFLSNAKEIHEEQVSKENLKIQNEQIERINKYQNKSESDPDRLKLYDENKTTVKVGEVERE